MKKIILLIEICLPLFVCAQEKGVHFEKGLSWQQILGKAKAENKYIFIDCFATWCGPCKQMDKTVYAAKGVGEYINARFISIKVQMDSTQIDSPEVLEWYGDAKMIQRTYQVNVMPTYLFFSSEGQIMHRESGAVPDSIFLKVAQHAMDPKHQYYTRLKKYRMGQMSYQEMPRFAILVKEKGDMKFADTIAANYFHNYLDKLNEREFNRIIDADFMISFGFLLSSKDNVFNWIYNDGKVVDNLVKSKNYSRNVIEHIITVEEINPVLWPNNKSIEEKPDWDKLMMSIKLKYNKVFVDLALVDARLKWYSEKSDWPEITKYTVKKIHEFGVDTIGILGKIVTNNLVYLVIFEHSTKKQEIHTGIQVMKELVKEESGFQAGFMDTYANLLYKAGRIRKALEWEKRALKLEYDKEAAQNLEKMKRHAPTWQ
jgi:thioredoxin-related protein